MYVILSNMNIEEYLLSLGYDDKEPLYEPGKKLSIKISFDFNGKKINICPYIVPYYSKKSYIAAEYNYSSYYDTPEVTKQKILNLISYIKYPEPGRVGDMGWDAEYLIDPREFSAEERAGIVVSSFKKFRSLILRGEWLDGIRAQPGDIVASRPIGIKFDMGFNDESEKEGTLQRSILSKKVFKFGELKEDGMQYSIIGEDLDMHPI